MYVAVFILKIYGKLGPDLYADRSVFLIDPSGITIYDDSRVIHTPCVACGMCLRRKGWTHGVSGRLRRCLGYTYPMVPLGTDLDTVLIGFP